MHVLVDLGPRRFSHCRRVFSKVLTIVVSGCFIMGDCYFALFCISEFSTFSAIKLYYFHNEKKKVVLIRFTYINAITFFFYSYLSNKRLSLLLLVISEMIHFQTL